ncbi:MAG: shikimate dehydrogenase [Archaeoglobaceae archaeon]|nr:shikimate dehydrogenase [Archaeoglobaceae archaeon]MCX8152268.1 shikimate dehydrogenase [Archaeoglobaceae archaeon]MDW8013946.1 shikimate dehydrogenase [Archaeoglobaceae archaeon]
MIYLGLIGYPVKHSVSPSMHNAALKFLGIEGIYMAFEVKPNDLVKAIEGAKALGFLGLNVTIPYKEEVAKLVKTVGDAAKINTVNVLDLKNSIGYNTDVFGVEESFRRENIDVEGKVALVVGAGGAGKASALAMLKMGAKVVVTNRTVLRGLETVEMLRNFGECIFIPFDEINKVKGRVDIIINATPIGMLGFESSLPIPGDLVEKDLIVFDTVYNPPETPLIKLAKERGCKVVSGVEMLIYQGAKALEIWLKVDAPVEVMRRAVLKELGLK